MLLNYMLSTSHNMISALLLGEFWLLISELWSFYVTFVIRIPHIQKAQAKESVRFSCFILLFHCSIVWLCCSLPYVIYVVLLWHDIACLC